VTEHPEPYLPAGLPIPSPERDGLSKPYWDGLKAGRLLIQRCSGCGIWQWGPEWICHSCNGFDLGWEEVRAEGRIYSWERVWHAVHPALKTAVPYLVVLVELEEAKSVRLIGNLLGDPRQEVSIGTEVVGEFEHHTASEPPFSLLQWRVR
jgi:uncharacterized OB-fold protein